MFRSIKETEPMNSYRLMKDVGSRTRMDPSKRLDSLRRWIQRVKTQPDAYDQLKKWGLDLDDQGKSISVNINIRTILQLILKVISLA